MNLCILLTLEKIIIRWQMPMITCFLNNLFVLKNKTILLFNNKYLIV